MIGEDAESGDGAVVDVVDDFELKGADIADVGAIAVVVVTSCRDLRGDAR